jgi:NitT/TauT family transport system substrate-binding protein
MRYTRLEALGLLGAAAVVPLAANAQSTPLRVATSINDAFIEPYYAEDHGFFNAVGITAEMQTVANGATAVQAVTAGAVDVGLADMTSIANAYNHGLPIQIFAGGALWDGSLPTVIALCVPKASPIMNAKDLEHKTIGLQNLRSINTAAVSEWATSNGADVSTIKFFELPFTEMQPALARGVVDAILIVEPFLTIYKNDLRQLASPHNWIGKKYYIGVWFSTRDWIAKNQDSVKRLPGAIYSSARWANGNPAESALIVSKYSKIPVDLIFKMARTPQSTSLEANFAQPVLDISWKYKIIDKPVKATDLLYRG